jgi:resuscitation-promoting factor RpfB
MAVNGIALGITGLGVVFMWAGIKGVSVTAVVQDVVTGKNPKALPQTNQIQSGSVSGALTSSTLNPGVSSPVLPSGGNAGSSVSSYQAYAFSLFPSFGWGTDQEQPLVNLWNQESGWDPTAYNPGSHTTNPDDSHAFGIPQALPASKMASAGSDWRTNPATQIRWGLGYIRSTYGNPAAAWAHEQAFNWY